MTIGRWGEQIASQYFASKGYEIITRNYHTRYGELDLVTKKDQTLVFVEVKTRSNQEYGTGEQAITPKKLQALRDSITVYLETFPEPLPEWQIDLIVVEGALNSPDPILLHYENLGEISLL
ncbi:MAG: YraN family protein [Anaerolineaceae bacterium]